MTTRSIEAEAPGVLVSTAAADDAEHGAWLAARNRRLWRRRILPTLGIVGLLLLWWAVVVFFDVKPFIAPSPVLVLQTLYAKRDVLLSNLCAHRTRGGRRLRARQSGGHSRLPPRSYTARPCRTSSSPWC